MIIPWEAMFTCRPIFPSLFLLMICFSATAAAATTTTFTTEPLNLENFMFLEDAHIFNDTTTITVRLTRDLLVPNSGAGMLLYKYPIPFRQPGNPNPTSFKAHLTFSVKDLNPNSIGGGLALAISPGNGNIGAGGKFLGIPKGAVSIEFDTAKDTELHDVNGNHVGLNINSVVSLCVADLDSVNISLKSGKLIHVWVDYSGPGHQLKVFVSYVNIQPVSPVLEAIIDLYQYVEDLMFVGISASTQASTEVHSLEHFSFSSCFDEDPNTNSGGFNAPPRPPMATVSSLAPDTTRKTRKSRRKISKSWLTIILPVVFPVGITLTGGISIYFICKCYCCSDRNNENATHLFTP